MTLAPDEGKTNHLGGDAEGGTALAAVVAVLVLGHEDTGAAFLTGALTAEAADLVVAVDLVELEHGKLHGLVPAKKSKVNQT